MAVNPERARQIYLEYVQLDPYFTIVEFAKRSEELLGTSISLRHISKWAEEMGWNEEAKHLRRSLEEDRVVFMLDLCYGQAMDASRPQDVSGFTRSYLNTLGNMPDGYVVKEEERIRDLKELIYATTREHKERITSTNLSSLTAVYTQLNKRLTETPALTRDPGIDVDGWLLGVADSETLTAIPQRRLSPAQFQEFLKCMNDIEHLTRTYGWLKHTSRGAIRWDKPYPYQIEMLQALQRGENVIAKKSRQIGCSWTIADFIGSLVVFIPDIEVIILSKSELYAVKFLEKVKFFVSHLPRWMQPLVVTSSQTKFSVRFKAGTGEMGTSDVYSLTTTTDSGRSFSARFVALDEAAYLPYADDIWGAVLPTASQGGQIAVISTPRGTANFYFRLWTQVELGEEDEFTPIVAYYKDCGFDEKWLKRASAGMTTQQVLQEYEMQFIASGSPFFDLTHLALCYKPESEHPEILDAQGHNIKVKTRMSFTGVDTSGGRKTQHGDADYHSIVTLNEFGVQVASFHSNKMRLEEFAGYTMVGEKDNVEVEGVPTKWHREYPGAMLIETWGSGDSVYTRHQTPNDDRSYVVGRKTSAGKFGTGSKSRMLNNLRMGFAGRQMIITDPFTYKCLQAFEDKGDGKAEAAPGMFDDPVIALALAYSELHKWGGYILDLPDETTGGQRMVALRGEKDLPAQKLADVLAVGIIQGPIVESPGNRREADEFDHMQPSRLHESP